MRKQTGDAAATTNKHGHCGEPRGAVGRRGETSKEQTNRCSNKKHKATRNVCHTTYST
jgi:hypothetical protein